MIEMKIPRHYQYLAEELKTVKKTNDCSDVRRDIFESMGINRIQ